MEKCKRVGVVALLVDDREKNAGAVNAVISDFGRLIIGRMGVPYRERSVSIISLLVDGDTDELGAMTGRLGNIPGVRIRTLLLTDGETLPRRHGEDTANG